MSLVPSSISAYLVSQARLTSSLCFFTGLDVDWIAGLDSVLDWLTGFLICSCHMTSTLPDVLNLVTLCCYKLHFIIQENVHECQCTNYMDEHVPKVMVSSLHLLAVSKQHVKED